MDKYVHKRVNTAEDVFESTVKVTALLSSFGEELLKSGSEQPSRKVWEGTNVSKNARITNCNERVAAKHFKGAALTEQAGHERTRVNNVEKRVSMERHIQISSDSMPDYVEKGLIIFHM